MILKKTVSGFLITLFYQCLAVLACLLSLPSVSFAQMLHPDRPNTAKKCAICHLRWVYPFYTEHRDGELLPQPGKDVVATPEMCLSCHDGSIVDSRDNVFHGPGHKAGIIPSKNVVIPEDFPLDEKGQLQCSTCHTPHALPGTAETEVGIYLRASNEDSHLCRLCHVNKLGGAKQGNHSIDVSAKKKPLEILRAGGRFGEKKPNKVICETCHIAHGGINNKFLILPVEDPRTRSILCESCHGKNPVLQSKQKIVHSKGHPVDIRPKKVQFPQQWSHGEKVITGNNGELVCRTCHSPHNAVEKKALLSDRNYRDSLCMQCHKREKAVSKSTHDLSVSVPNERNNKGRLARNIGPCSSCHRVHGGGEFFLWARRLKSRIQSIDDLCFDCHAPKGCAGKSLTGEFTHPVGISIQIGAASFPLPLFDTKGREDKEGKVWCLTCHDVHDPKPLYYNHSEKNINHGKYLRIIQGKDSKLCTVCHQRHGFVKDTDHDLRITAPDFKNIRGETPAQGGLCSPCHIVHNAKQQRYLWSAPIGPSVVDGWNPSYSSQHDLMTGLCTGCHAPGQIAGKQVPRLGLHPKGFVVPEDEFLEGKPKITFEMVKEEFPLFTNTGEVDEQGNIVCSTCHNPHQWDPAREVKGPGKNVEGNATNSFLRPDLHSKFCTGCHGEGGLFKFKYFHSPLGRVKEEESPFPSE